MFLAVSALNIYVEGFHLMLYKISYGKNALAKHPLNFPCLIPFSLWRDLLACVCVVDKHQMTMILFCGVPTTQEDVFWKKS